jgi:hypothetical protein
MNSTRPYINYLGTTAAVLQGLSAINISKARRLPYLNLNSDYKISDKLYITYVNVLEGVVHLYIKHESITGLGQLTYTSSDITDNIAHFEINRYYELTADIDISKTPYFNLQTETDKKKLPVILAENHGVFNKYLTGIKSDLGYLIEDAEFIGGDFDSLNRLSVGSMRNDGTACNFRLRINGTLTNPIVVPSPSTTTPLWLEYKFNNSTIRLLIRFDWFNTGSITFEPADCMFDKIFFRVREDIYADTLAAINANKVPVVYTAGNNSVQRCLLALNIQYVRRLKFGSLNDGRS